MKSLIGLRTFLENSTKKILLERVRILDVSISCPDSERNLSHGFKNTVTHAGEPLLKKYCILSMKQGSDRPKCNKRMIPLQNLDISNEVRHRLLKEQLDSESIRINTSDVETA